MIAKCERCGDLYEAGSEEQACEPHPLCWECAKILRWTDMLEHSRRECAKWATMTGGGHRDHWQRRADEYAEIIEYIGARPHEASQTTWQCGCGHVNGASLPTCSACGRRPEATQ